MADLFFVVEVNLRLNRGTKTAQTRTWRHKNNQESKSNRYWDSTSARTKTNLRIVSPVRAAQNKFLALSFMKVTVSKPVLIYTNLRMAVNVPVMYLLLLKWCIKLSLLRTEQGVCLTPVKFGSADYKLYITNITHGFTHLTPKLVTESILNQFQDFPSAQSYLPQQPPR
jgi:hypothetical protein